MTPVPAPRPRGGGADEGVVVSGQCILNMGKLRPGSGKGGAGREARRNACFLMTRRTHSREHLEAGPSQGLLQASTVLRTGPHAEGTASSVSASPRPWVENWRAAWVPLPALSGEHSPSITQRVPTRKGLSSSLQSIWSCYQDDVIVLGGHAQKFAGLSPRKPLGPGSGGGGGGPTLIVTLTQCSKAV